MIKKLLCLLIILILIGCQIKGTSEIIEEEVQTTTDEEIKEKYWFTESEIITEIMSTKYNELAVQINDFLDHNDFNGVALIAQGEEIVLLNAYGVANVEQELPMTVTTQFQIGSVSKPFIAISILQLVEDGFLTLDQTIDKFFPDLERGNEITIHQLLTHSSGLNSGDGLVNYSSFTTTDQLIAYAFMNIHYHNEPGFVVYSNLGYDMLGVILEKVTGMSYEDYLQRNILDIAYMKDSGLNISGAELENLATAYAGHITQGETARVFHPSFGFSSGGMHSTAMDLFRFSQALYDGSLLTPESYALMTTPFTVINGTNYGYGWFINPRNHERVISHNGDLLGWHSILLRHQENEFTVILLTNQSGSARNINMAHSIIDMITTKN